MKFICKLGAALVCLASLVSAQSSSSSSSSGAYSSSVTSSSAGYSSSSYGSSGGSSSSSYGSSGLSSSSYGSSSMSYSSSAGTVAPGTVYVPFALNVYHQTCGGAQVATNTAMAPTSTANRQCQVFNVSTMAGQSPVLYHVVATCVNGTSPQVYFYSSTDANCTNTVEGTYPSTSPTSSTTSAMYSNCQTVVLMDTGVQFGVAVACNANAVTPATTGNNNGPASHTNPGLMLLFSLFASMLAILNYRM